MALHNEQVWRGRAAEASRERLRRVIARSVHFLESDLAAVSRSLRVEGERLDELAAAWRREAHLRAQAELQAAREAHEQQALATDEDRTSRRHLAQPADAT